MNAYLAAAAALAIVVGLLHSVLGERMLFSRLRQGSWGPTQGGPPLRGAHLRIVWATWHVVTVLGWAVAAALLLLAAEPSLRSLHVALVQLFALAMLASGALVLVGTRGRHPGWIGLFGVAGLSWLGLPG